MEGRDIGTVVFPAANLKVFLDADPDVRARRRLQDQENADGAGAAAVLEEITQRDRRDQTRDVSPLVPAADAIRIDTSNLTAAQVTDRIVELALARQQLR
jgi:cytidylate kinase